MQKGVGPKMLKLFGTCTAFTTPKANNELSGGCTPLMYNCLLVVCFLSLRCCFCFVLLTPCKYRPIGNASYGKIMSSEEIPTCCLSPMLFSDL